MLLVVPQKGSFGSHTGQNVKNDSNWRESVYGNNNNSNIFVVVEVIYTILRLCFLQQVSCIIL